MNPADLAQLEELVEKSAREPWRYGGALHRALRALLSEHAIPEWQPIETAPKDGTFLVWLSEPMCGSRVHAARYHPNVNTIGNGFLFDAPQPIYWMPLPKPPLAAAKETK
jgi:hypothetical protein